MSKVCNQHVFFVIATNQCHSKKFHRNMKERRNLCRRHSYCTTTWCFALKGLRTTKWDEDQHKRWETDAEDVADQLPSLSHQSLQNLIGRSHARKEKLSTFQQMQLSVCSRKTILVMSPGFEPQLLQRWSVCVGVSHENLSSVCLVLKQEVVRLLQPV